MRRSDPDWPPLGTGPAAGQGYAPVGGAGAGWYGSGEYGLAEYGLAGGGGAGTRIGAVVAAPGVGGTGPVTGSAPYAAGVPGADELPGADEVPGPVGMLAGPGVPEAVGVPDDAGGPNDDGLAGGTDEPGGGGTEVDSAGVELGWTESGAATAEASAGATGLLGGTAEAAGSWPAWFVGFSLMRTSLPG